MPVNVHRPTARQQGDLPAWRALCRARSEGRAGREGHGTEESTGEPGWGAPRHLNHGLPGPERDGVTQSAWRRAAKAWPGREGRAARHTSPQVFSPQPAPRGASPQQLGAEAHALPGGAAEPTQNISPRAVRCKGNMTNGAAMRGKYCLNLYWNPFSNQANHSHTLGRLTNTDRRSMESNGSFTKKSNEQTRRCRWGRN